MELKSCPFCGGEPEMDTLRSYRNITTGRLGDGVAVYCTGCSADMMMCRADHPGMETEGMIYVMREAWNRRTPASQALPQRSDSPSPADEAARRIVESCDKNGHVYETMADEIEDGVTVARAYLALPTSSGE